MLSDCTDPEGADFTPPEVAGLSAVGFLFSGGGVEADLVSSGIARESSHLAPSVFGKNVHFYQLERMVSTQDRRLRALSISVLL